MNLKRRLVTLLICLFCGLGCFFINAQSTSYLINKSNVIYQDFTHIVSDYVYIYDLENDKEVYQKNGFETFYPASLTKMMTLIVGIENIADTSQLVTLDETIFDGLVEAQASRAGFGVDDQVSVLDLFYGIMLPSGAECTRGIASIVSGNEDAYVELMNQKAKELGMENTHFVNTSGLHDENHFSTPYDMAILLKYCLQNDLFRQIFTTYEYTSSPTATYPTKGLLMEATTKRYCKRIYEDSCPSFLLGSKTGFTNPALYCLASLGDVNGHEYIMISGHAPWEMEANNVTDAVNTYQKMIHDAYEYKILFNPNDYILSDKIAHTLNQSLNFVANEEIGFYLPKDANVTIQYHQEIAAPLAANSHVATVVVEYDGTIYCEIPLVVESTIEQNDFIVLIENIIQWIAHYWLVLIAIAIALFASSICFIQYKRAKIRKLRAQRRRARMKKRMYED